jgi:hypothetical protein
MNNFNRKGASLAVVFDSYLASMPTLKNEDETRSVGLESTRWNGDRVESRLVHGESGIVADIHNAKGQFRIQQAVDDSHLVPCASLFALPGPQQLGWWAVHVNNGRSVKGLITEHFITRFQHDYPDLMLKINPAVPRDAFKRAVDQGKIAEVTLRRYERPHDREDAAVDKWVDAGTYAKTEVRISGIKDNRLLPGRLKRFLAGTDGALEDILEFRGMKFEEARVTVEQEDGKQRTFNISALESGHPFTQDLSGLKFQKGDPTQESLLSGLEAVLNQVL